MDERHLRSLGYSNGTSPTPSPSTDARLMRETRLPAVSVHYATSYTTPISTAAISSPFHSSTAPASVWSSASTPDPSAALLSHGCIALTFGRSQAEIYLAHILGVPSQSDWVISFGIAEHAGAYRAILGTPGIARTIDYDAGWVRGKGCLVPQTLWRPASDLDHMRLVNNTRLESPIWFDMLAGGVGISLADAVDGNREGLRDKDSQVSMNDKATTMIRLVIQGQPEKQGVQIHIRDDKVLKAPITRDRLVRHVGSAVEKIYNVCSVLVFYTCAYPLTLPTQALGLLSGPNDRHLVLIVGIIHVSAGCWQPLLLKVAPANTLPGPIEHTTHSSSFAAYPM
ncbi:hypothetical protein PENSPDRAFT_629049 [Peniophora sp. CONT]|nr:hypothetical protein PENSPDRAFT_629049 [Peniophora sp. CONT]